MNRRRIQNAKAIFVDFFDTLIFRSVTADELMDRWAGCLQSKFPSLQQFENPQLSRMRKEAFQRGRQRLLQSDSNQTEVTYEEAIGEVYLRLQKSLPDIRKEAFIHTSMEIDASLEYGCQYANRRLLSVLKKAKEQGKQIYILSDYYLGEKYIRRFLYAANIPDGLIDDIFVSCDFRQRKASGDIYTAALHRLGIKASDAVMIGDNVQSDYQKAKDKGITSILQRHLFHKGRIHLRQRLGMSYSTRQMKFSMNQIFRNGKDYGEYIAIFYVFIKRLYDALRKEKVKEIAFMAREGFYLRTLFEEFQNLRIPDDQSVQTSYYWCSRRSVMSGVREALLPEYISEEMSLKYWLKSLNLNLEDAMQYLPFSQEDAESVCKLNESPLYRHLMSNASFRQRVDATIQNNQRAFLKYTWPFIHEGIFRFVDSGWKGTTQNVLEKYYGVKTKGYYIGVQNPDEPILDHLSRTGLIFSEEDPRSRYYDYLGTNIPFYQQLLAAPHGTALQYVLHDDGVEVLNEWDSMEEELFRKHIQSLQDYMLLKFKGLCLWDDKEAGDEKQDWFIAKLSMKSSLFAHGTRQKFIRMCTDHYVQNFRQENRGKVRYDYKKAKIGADILWRPEKYLRYISKVQRTSIYDHFIIKLMYPLTSIIYYGYTLILHLMKSSFIGE